METGDPEVRLGSGVTLRQQAYINSRNLVRLLFTYWSGEETRHSFPEYVVDFTSRFFSEV